MHGAAGRLAIASAPEVDTLVSAIVGVAGLEATYQALRARKRVGLANKETLVAGGRLVMDAVREYGAELIPVDSEHNGAHQCLRAGNRRGQEADSDRLRRTVPEHSHRKACSCDAGAGFEASNMEDGSAV